jgi:hypothetical protein
VKAGIDPRVTEAVVEQVTRERARQAVILQDQGKIKEARELLLQNASQIQGLTATMAPSKRMRDLQSQYYSLGASVAPAAPAQINLERKMLRQLDAGMAGSGVRY